MAKLQLNGLSEAKKITKIHDYICNHVDYAYNSTEEQIYTAYGALCTGKAVCQGYAVLSTDCARKQGCRSELSAVPEMEDRMRGT